MGFLNLKRSSVMLFRLHPSLIKSLDDTQNREITCDAIERIVIAKSGACRPRIPEHAVH